jgi:hypothetical protein
MIRNRAALLLVSLAVTVAFTSHRGSALVLAQEQKPTVAVDDAVAVKLLSAGAEPRSPLRYSVTPGSKERLEMTMQISMAIEMAGNAMPPVDMPPLKMIMDIDVLPNAPNGDLSFSVTFAEISMEGNLVPSGTFDAIKGLTAAVTMNDRGVVSNMKFAAETITDPTIRQIMSASDIEKLSAPLPIEPIGVGGKWEVTQPLEVGGIKSVQKALYEIVSIDATGTTMTVSLEQSAAAQKGQSPVPGADVSLISMTGTGKGRVVLTAGQVVPYGNVDHTSKMVMEISDQGQTQRMATNTKMKMTVAKGKRSTPDLPIDVGGDRADRTIR